MSIDRQQRASYVWIEMGDVRPQYSHPSADGDTKGVVITMDGRVWNESDHPVLLERVDAMVHGKEHLQLDREHPDQSVEFLPMRKLGACECCDFSLSLARVFDMDLEGFREMASEYSLPFGLTIKVDWRYNGELYLAEHVVLKTTQEEDIAF